MVWLWFWLLGPDETEAYFQSYLFHIVFIFFRIYSIFISYLFCSCFQPRNSSPTATPPPRCPAPTQALSACPARPGRKPWFFPYLNAKALPNYIFSHILFCSYFFHNFFIFFSILFSYFSHIFLIGAYLLFFEHKEATSRPPGPHPAPLPPPQPLLPRPDPRPARSPPPPHFSFFFDIFHIFHIDFISDFKSHIVFMFANHIGTIFFSYLDYFNMMVVLQAS